MSSTPPNLSATAVPVVKEETGFYEPYSDYHRNLRLWFLAYGIGTPVFLTQLPEVIKALKDGKELRLVMALFLAGVIIQVFTALLYKTAMWYLYMHELKALNDKSVRVQISEWLSEAYWLEALFDLATLGCFAYATWRVIGVAT
jgi:hypothetical protein